MFAYKNGFKLRELKKKGLNLTKMKITPNLNGQKCNLVLLLNHSTHGLSFSFHVSLGDWPKLNFLINKLKLEFHSVDNKYRFLSF